MDGTGSGEDMNDLFMYSPEEELWTNLTGLVQGNPPSPRDSFSMAAFDGRVFVFGGYNGIQGILTTCSCFVS